MFGRRNEICLIDSTWFVVGNGQWAIDNRQWANYPVYIYTFPMDKSVQTEFIILPYVTPNRDPNLGVLQNWNGRTKRDPGYLYVLSWEYKDCLIVKVGKTATDLDEYLEKRYPPGIFNLRAFVYVHDNLRALENKIIDLFANSFAKVARGREWFWVETSQEQNLASLAAGLRDFVSTR